MTLAEAAASIGARVLYRSLVPEIDPDEEGVITGVSEHLVFVRYGRYAKGQGSKATDPDRLTLTGGAR